MMTQPEHLVSIQEAARITGLDKGTLYRLARQQKIRAFRVLGRSLRFERGDLLRLVRAVESVAEPDVTPTRPVSARAHTADRG
jgi:excisionase family DNA binding protein